MRVRVVQESVLPGLELGRSGLQHVEVGDFAHHVTSGDAVVLYRHNNDFSECCSLLFCEVVSSYPEQGRCTFDTRPYSVIIQPSSRIRHLWRKKPFMCLDVSSVAKYDLITQFMRAFDDVSWGNRKLEDSKGLVFRPDLSRPTLMPVVGFVYLFKSSDLYKIGKSIDTLNRKRQVERDVREDLREVHRFKSNDYTRAEAILHQRFAAKRVRGEWFDLSETDLAEVLKISEMNFA